MTRDMLAYGLAGTIVGIGVAGGLAIWMNREVT